MRTFRTLAALLSLFPPLALAVTYDDAALQSKTDALDPPTRQWYLKEMRPAFSTFFGKTINECVGAMSPDSQASFGLVFTVTPSGTVKSVYWRVQNHFTACVEPKLRAMTFPASPKDEFYFGLVGS